MKRHLQTINILIASSLLLCLQQHHHCDAAPTFARRRRAIAIRKNDDGSILSTPSSTTGYVNFKPRASFHNNNKPFKLIRGGDILLQSTTLITTIVGQALNIAMAALVTSGYVGCYIASFLIRHLQFYCNTIATTTTTATAADAINSSNNDFTLQNYKWTILATLTHVLLNLSNNNILVSSNPTFLPTLWAYSHYVNPTLGGFIGCTHLVLGGVSSLLGSKRIVDNVSNLMDVRLPPLDEDGNMSYNVDTFQKEEGGFKNDGVMRQVLVRILSSCSIFTSFPRDMLSLYMGISALLTFLISLDLDYDNNGMWKVVRNQIPWWRDGLFGGGGGTGADMVVDTREVTMRLFVMHWIVMVVKGTISALVLQR